MMQKTTTSRVQPAHQAPRPQLRRRDAFFHMIKTGKVIGALTRDRRVPLARKGLFFTAIGGLLVLLLFPDILGETVMSIVLPFVGTVLGIPLDAGFDWIALALATVGLLRIFPNEIVGEHYERIFHKKHPVS